MADWIANQVIQGRYRLESLLGKGGMGSVWRAEHLKLKSMIAVKRLDESVAANPDALARFVREAQASAALRSPNVVQVFDYGVDDGVAFIAMELLQGESLAARLKRVGRLPIGEAIQFLSEVLRAAGKAHAAGIVHRDLKPDNIFICREEPEYAKVLDFGVAKLTSTGVGADATSMTSTGMIIGTPYYMSPEQAQARGVDSRSDLWAIGVIAYECLTGRLPFFAHNIAEILIAICDSEAPKPSQIAKVPIGFNEWFERATKRERSERFQTAKEMADALSVLSPSSSVRGADFALSAPPSTSQTPHPALRRSEPPPSPTPASFARSSPPISSQSAPLNFAKTSPSARANSKSLDVLRDDASAMAQKAEPGGGTLRVSLNDEERHALYPGTSDEALRNTELSTRRKRQIVFLVFSGVLFGSCAFGALYFSRFAVARIAENWLGRSPATTALPEPDMGHTVSPTAVPNAAATTVADAAVIPSAAPAASASVVAASEGSSNTLASPAPSQDPKVTPVLMFLPTPVPSAASSARDAGEEAPARKARPTRTSGRASTPNATVPSGSDALNNENRAIGRKL